ncbi:ABC transporter ATP-binding protein [Aquabacter spiritensis]|uniref:Peptide/nickel transport system ATP-binding protein/oligopeptide transport system ATP-binding protein n=1 Tax=Aquabacter spiritensis TaxID=933073 RepID=A0A4V2UYK4_9HYPH|nr:ABC transporter ATP-binding protein [Aquabacter spiritensis]TCT07808.1 peptide/nickel transport system ATP-binding protein/oligopeptide transport system ATP-binding protein [Aquabacter spiritensis]
MAEPLLSVENLVTHIFTDHGVVKAVDGVSLTIAPGEAVALVGESGSGKSMTAQSLMRLPRPPARILSGSVRFEGRDLLTLSEREMRAIRGGRMGMIFQDPSTYLNPLMRVGDQIAEAVMLHRKMRRAAARAEALEAMRLVRIPAPETVMDYYPHQLSGGMRQRILIAMVVTSRPSLMIADEPTTALDVTVQAQIMRLLAGLRTELGSALLLITHDLGLVAEFCDRVYVMYGGRIVETGTAEDIFYAPRHPYTRALMRSTLGPERRVERFEAIEGNPPNLARLPPGCSFNPRCPERLARCAHDAPPLFASASGVASRCWLAEGGSDERAA